MAELWLVGSCWTCRTPFMFNPDTVPSVLVDPVTNLPPDLGGDAGRAVREPLCESCIDLVNVERRKHGMPEIKKTPTEE